MNLYFIEVWYDSPILFIMYLICQGKFVALKNYIWKLKTLKISDLSILIKNMCVWGGWAGNLKKVEGVIISEISEIESKPTKKKNNTLEMIKKKLLLWKGEHKWTHLAKLIKTKETEETNPVLWM